MGRTLAERRHWTAAGVNLLVMVGLDEAARELEGVLCDIDAQMLGVTFPREAHGEGTQERPIESFQ